MNSSSLISSTQRTLPLVSVIIPCRNEERYIEQVLKRLASQQTDYVFEVIIVDALSTDGTLEKINDFSKHAFFDIVVIQNPKIIIPAGMNIGIQHARGEIIIRMDGHSVPHDGYLQKAVDTLRKGYDVVGGICLSKPGENTLTAKAISAAISNLFGVGDSRFRLAHSIKKGQLVDTVPFGCFRKELWHKLGGFNEKLLTNEDYDFNYRVRKMGGAVFLNPELVTDYYGRKSFRGIAGQFYRYGTWKLIMLLGHPSSIRWRHFIPPLFVLSIFFLAGAGFFSIFFLKLLAAEIILYLLLSITASLKAAFRSDSPAILFLLPAVFAVMHFSWGWGMISALIRNGILKIDPLAAK